MNKEYKTTKCMIYKSDALIEGWYHAGSPSMCVLLLPPHPALGGKISNSVLRLMHEAFADAGFSTLRINYRGIGLSRDPYSTNKDRSIDLQDSLHALDWLSTKHGDPKILWIAGFGYGAHLTINASMRRPGVHGFIAVTPYDNSTEFNILTPCPNGLIISGSDDRVASPKMIQKIAADLTTQKGCTTVYKQIQGADHNYINHREVLRIEIMNYLNKILAEEEPTAVCA